MMEQHEYMDKARQYRYMRVKLSSCIHCITLLNWTVFFYCSLLREVLMTCCVLKVMHYSIKTSHLQQCKYENESCSPTQPCDLLMGDMIHEIIATAEAWFLKLYRDTHTLCRSGLNTQ